METTRRDLLKGMSGMALGVVVTSGLGALVGCAPKEAQAAQATATPQPQPQFPWPYQKVDAVAAAERAYAAYYQGGCMYGAFEGILGELREKVGGPYLTFPSAMMKYGAGGIAGWGTLCGALNGAAALLYLVLDGKVANPIISELFAWYGSEELPNYKPKTPKFDTIATSAANSQLCHVSVSTWSAKSGFKTGSPERAERCAWLTASVAKYVVELLNQQADSAFKAAHNVPEDVKTCLSCHGKGGQVENVHATAQSSCTVCHTDIKPNHPSK